MWKLTDKYFPGVWTDQRGGWSVNYYKNYNIIESQYMIAIIYLCL